MVFWVIILPEVNFHIEKKENGCLINLLLDRTGELRKLGFAGRRLGPLQMTTDTAVNVTKRVVEDKSTRIC